MQPVGAKETLTLTNADLGSSGEVKTFDKGSHTIPYTIVIPNEFTWHGKKQYPLPPTFLKKEEPQNIAYALEVNLLKKDIFSANEL